MNQVATAQENAPVEVTTASDIMLSEATMQHVETLAKKMAESKVTVPIHLQGNEGDCLAIIMQSLQWGMNPFVVSQKTHLVNGTLAYEAQLVNAVVQSSGMIDGAFNYEYQGEGEGLQCRVGAVLRGQGEITWNEWLTLSEVKVRNSPLWKTNPKQQMGYLQVKNWSRLFCPGAILGVYTVDELRDAPGGEREIGPGAQVQTSDLSAELAGKGEREIGPGAQVQTSDLSAELAGKGEQAEEVIEDPKVIEDEPAAEQEQEPEKANSPHTYATMADKMNKATTPQDLAGLTSELEEFCGTAGNEKYREELRGVYSDRMAKLKEPVE